jgi:hypothetical protein
MASPAQLHEAALMPTAYEIHGNDRHKASPRLVHSLVEVKASLSRPFPYNRSTTGD